MSLFVAEIALSTQSAIFKLEIPFTSFQFLPRSFYISHKLSKSQIHSLPIKLSRYKAPVNKPTKKGLWKIYAHQLIFKVLRYFIEIVPSSKSILSFTKFPHYYTEQLLSSTCKPEIPHRWYENLRNIPGKNSFWNAVLLPINL